MFDIYKNIPIPAAKRGVLGFKYNFADMEVGDMMFVPDQDGSTADSRTKMRKSVAAVASQFGRKHGIKMRTSQVHMGGKWGVGVWRLE